MSTLQETITHLTQKIETLEEQLQTFGNFNKLPWNNFCPISEGKTSEVGVAFAEIQEMILAAPVAFSDNYESQDQFVEELEDLDKLIKRFELLKKGYHCYLIDKSLATSDDLLETKASEVLIR